MAPELINSLTGLVGTIAALLAIVVGAYTVHRQITSDHERDRMIREEKRLIDLRSTICEVAANARYSLVGCKHLAGLSMIDRVNHPQSQNIMNSGVKAGEVTQLALLLLDPNGASEKLLGDALVDLNNKCSQVSSDQVMEPNAFELDISEASEAIAIVQTLTQRLLVDKLYGVKTLNQFKSAKE